MARKPRIHFPGALYHVIAQGDRRQKIFRREIVTEAGLVIKIPSECTNSADRNRLGHLAEGWVILSKEIVRSYHKGSGGAF